MRAFTRRLFIERLLQTSGVLTLGGLSSAAFAQTNYSGKLLVTVQCSGAWDVSSFCDPKTNVNGEKEINHWARTGSIATAGKLSYAPYGSNAKFFQKHYGKMLVINGVDAQTNAHETGETTNWSGRLSLGYPSLTALFAAVKAPDLGLAYVKMGGWGNTEGIIGSTRISNPQALRSVLYPNKDNNGNNFNFIEDNDMARVKALYKADLQALQADTTAMPQDLQNRAIFEQAIASSETLQAFANILPAQDKLQQARSAGTNSNHTLHQQAQLAMLAFKSGLAVAADLFAGGFDTHAFHDRDHEPLLSLTLDAVDYLWDYAEEQGLADRLVVVMGSDFSRTPYYNAGDGKDHWPIGSYVVMEKNASYTNRAVGLTDGGQNAYKIDPTTLLRRDSGGTQLLTNHVHKALRKYLGLDIAAVNKAFPFNNIEDVRFFG